MILGLALPIRPGPAAQVRGEFDRWLGSDQGGYFNTATDASGNLLIRRSYADSAAPAC